MMMFMSPPSYSCEEVPAHPQPASRRATSHTDISSPPRYDELFRQFEVLESYPELTELRQIAYDAMAKEAAKPETVDKLLGEVRALAGSAKKVDDTFERVRIGLVKVDDNDYRDGDGNLIPRFQTKWLSFQKRWTVLLWESYNTATSTEAYIKDFVEVIIPIVEDIRTEEDRNDALQDLKEFIERKDPYGHKLDAGDANNAAVKHSQAYLNLKRDIEAFTADFDSFADPQSAKIRDRTDQVDLKLESIRQEIRNCRMIVWGFGIALGIDSGAAAGVLSAIGPVGPLVSFGILAAGLLAAKIGGDILISHLDKLGALKEEYRTFDEEGAAMQNQLCHLMGLERLLRRQKIDISDIAGRLDQFAALWKEVAHDAKMISNQLETFTNATNQSKKVRTIPVKLTVGYPTHCKAFERRLFLIKSGYTALGAALGEYATRVNQSDVKTLRDYTIL